MGESDLVELPDTAGSAAGNISLNDDLLVSIGECGMGVALRHEVANRVCSHVFRGEPSRARFPSR